MINFIRKGLGKVARWALIDPDSDIVGMDQPSMAPVRRRRNTVTSASASIESSGGLNFTVFPASGGTVIQFSTYDSRTDTSRTELYIVTEKDDLGQELSLIITKESLTR